MKKTITIFGILIITFLSTVAIGMQMDQEPMEFSGVVRNKKTNKKIARCKVFIKGTEVGTITNNDGEFSIKYSPEHAGRMLVFSAIGYARYEATTANLTSANNRIFLLPISVVMDEVVIRDPADILMDALSKVDENYPTTYENFSAFYRETIKKNKKFVDVSQGSLDIKKSPYSNNAPDKARIAKGYRSHDYKSMDTLVFKLKGGVSTMLYLDVVKNPGMVLRKDIMKFYDYELSDVKMIDEKLNFEISFVPKPNINTPLYTGKVYVEEASLGISEISFGYAGQDLVQAAKTLIQKKPSLADVTPLKVWYDIEYRKSGEKWYQYYTKSSLDMKVNWRKKLFNSTFYSSSEMVVTDRKTGQPEPPIENKQTVRNHHFFAEKAAEISDQDFWKAYNIIKPEDDLKKAMLRIEKKARR